MIPRRTGRRLPDPRTGRLARSLGPVQRLTTPPKALRRPSVHFDNVAIVPASLLPQRAKYQQIANALPRGQVLIIVPKQGPAQRRACTRVAARLKGSGHAVTTLAAEQLSL